MIISIEIEDRLVLDTLADLQRRSSDLSEPMADIARLLRNTAEDSFQDEVDPWGRSWLDLSERTKKAREKKGHWPGSILQVSGGLAASVTSGSGRDWASVGAAKVYAAIHQFGGKAGRGRKVDIPARPYLPFNKDGDLPPALRDDILEVLRDFFGVGL